MKVKKEMEVLSRAIERAVLTPQEKVAVGRSLQRLAAIMAGYSDAGDKGVIGGYNGTFPLTAATAGNIYLEPKTGKYYRCETNYNGTQITGPNSNFVDLSVVANADRLNNLGTLKITHVQYGTIRIPAQSSAIIQLEKKISSIDDFAIFAMEIGVPTTSEGSIYEWTTTTITLKSDHGSTSTKKYMIFYFN